MAKISSLFDEVMRKTIDSLDDKIDCFIKLYVYAVRVKVIIFKYI